MRQQGDEEMSLDEPEMVAKAFLYYVMARQPEALTELSASPTDGIEFTRANTLPGADMGHLMELCIEMPVARALPGEAFAVPGGIVRADASPDRLVLIGMFGLIELAFEVVRAGDEWKIVPRHYFEMLRAMGAI
jgi:hypothetical protein